MSFGYNSENMHFLPNIGKAEVCLGGVSLSLKNCKQTAKNCKQFGKVEKSSAL